MGRGLKADMAAKRNCPLTQRSSRLSWCAGRGVSTLSTASLSRGGTRRSWGALFLLATLPCHEGAGRRERERRFSLRCFNNPRTCFLKVFVKNSAQQRFKLAEVIVWGTLAPHPLPRPHKCRSPLVRERAKRGTSS